MKLRQIPKIMSKLTILYIFSLFLVPLTAQVADNFSDGNLMDTPTWEGDLNDFIINTDRQLQLNAAIAGTASITVNTRLEKEMEWNFFFQMDFNPSTSNTTRIYLQANDANLLNSSGYFLEIGESGSNDALQFYRQDEGTKVLLGKATLGAVAMTPTVKVRVVREETGDWQVFADYIGGNNLILDLTVNDATYNEIGDYYFGFYCKYTATRLTHFFFDEVAIAKLVADIIPPFLLNIAIIDEENITLLFDEPIAISTATDINNFLIDKGISNPIIATLEQANQIDLSLNMPLINNENYTLTIRNIEDLNGNKVIT